MEPDHYNYYCLAKMDNLEYCHVYMNSSIYENLNIICDPSILYTGCEIDGYCTTSCSNNINNEEFALSLSCLITCSIILLYLSGQFEHYFGKTSVA